MTPTQSPSLARFQGFAPETFAWFTGLEADNSKRYFTANRDTYDNAVRGALEAMFDELADEYRGVAKMFRPNRDVRFSADKSPYKTTAYGIIRDRPDGLPALYAHISATGLFAGSGYHMLASDQLARFRDAVAGDASGPALERAVAGAQRAGLETYGEALKTAPRGYPRDHPRIGLLRHKSLYAGLRRAPEDDGVTRDAALGHVRSTWAACAAINDWLAEHVGESELPADTRYGRGRRR